MSSTDNPSLKWCLYLLGTYIFENLKLRMKRLTGHIEEMGTGGISHFAQLSRWYIVTYWNRSIEFVRKKTKL